MIHPRGGRFGSTAWLLLALAFSLGGGDRAYAQPGPDAPGPQQVAGQFFQIEEPITNETLARLKAATRQYVDQAAGTQKGSRPILVFVFRGGEVAPGTSGYGVSYDLARLISRDLAGARLTVAYVPEPIQGYAVLPILACSEIVMGPKASLGPITPEGESVDPGHQQPLTFLAQRKAREPDLFLGLLDREADLRRVRTADKTIHHVLADHLEEFRKTHQVVEDQSAWAGGARGVLTAERALEDGFCKRTAENENEVKAIYQIGGQSALEDPTLGRRIEPLWIRIDGVLDSVKASYLARRIDQARSDGTNLIFFQINSAGGLDTAADAMADLIASINDMKTVAFIDDRALGVAALLPLACRDIVFTRASRLGDVRRLITGRDGQLQDLSELQIQSLSRKMALIARQKGRPEAVAVAMVDPEAEVVEAKDSKTGAVQLVLRSEVDQDPNRYQVIQTRKEPGQVLTVTGDEAGSYGLGQLVASVDELKALYGLKDQLIRVDAPGWVDSLVTILTDPYVSWLLLFVGLFMLVIELKLPGIGLPAITSALAFLLFFWSHYLSGTADQLEIILFLVGLICLALELFVFPGFGIFGMSGILLMLSSIVLASHTFVWPSQEYEYREMGHTLLQVTVVLVAVGGGAMVLARYFPSLPLFNRLVLKPEPWIGLETVTDAGKPSMEGYESLAFLIGESGRTTSPLRPLGKARFGNLLIDVSADGNFIESDSLVEVVDVQGTRVLVKKIGS
jgi:membrane-bound serine protease (ClpP class)